ncbi:MAG: sigma-54-dependent transcriptional regulator [Burkholderiaceae bacterium]
MAQHSSRNRRTTGGRAHVLVVDDDAAQCEAMGHLVALHDLTVASAHSLQEARREVAAQPPDLILLDLMLPDGSGIELLEQEPELSNAQVVLITAHASLETSIQAVRLGVADYLVKPINVAHLEGILSRLMRPATLKAEVDELWAEWRRSGRFGKLWGRAPAMLPVYEQIARVGATNVSVLITGESGTGKELGAQMIHALSRRRNEPFLALNCGAISPQLVESELFGHEKGSFTGADRQHHGVFERAGGGTLFLDEITEMPVDLQVKLLRVLETRRFNRVGSSTAQDADVRIIAASNRVLQHAVTEGRLREDLMYRLNVFPIQLPPLRDRLDDVPLLAKHCLQAICDSEGQTKHFSAEALEAMCAYSWPGNVRELRNVVLRAFVMESGSVIGAQRLVFDQCAVAPASAGHITVALGTSLAQAERALILATLEHFGNHKERTAAALGVSLKTLYNRLKEYQPRHSLDLDS